MVGNMLFGGGNNFLGSIFGSKEKTEQVTKNETTSNPSVNNSSSNLSSSSDQKAMDLSVECRKAVNLEKPECIKWFDDLSKNGSSVTSTGQVVQTVSYRLHLLLHKIEIFRPFLSKRV
jgi:hypothetical protein